MKNLSLLISFLLPSSLTFARELPLRRDELTATDRELDPLLENLSIRQPAL